MPAAGLLINSLRGEKENRTIEILASSVSARQLLTGKIAGLGLAGLLETLLWTPEDDYFLLDYHLRRLEDSAVYFEYSLDIATVRNRLLEQISLFSGIPHRVRLLVARDGDVTIEAASLTLEEPACPVRVKLAGLPVNSAEVFLYHKTTHRRIYEDARQSCPDCDDVLLWNERGELTESSVANVVVDISGALVTPPVDSGLLAGTFRAWLIDQGRIREQAIKAADLGNCSKIYLINSIRKWREAALI